MGFIGIGCACIPALILLILKIQHKNISGFLFFKLLAFEYLFINIFTLLIYFFELSFLQIYIFGFHYLFELIMFSMFFLQKMQLKNKFIFVTLLLFVLLFFSGLIYFQGVVDLDKYISVIVNVSIVVFSLHYIFGVYNENLVDNLLHDGVFLIASSLLFYHAVQFYFSFFESFIRSDKGSIFYYLWPIFQVSGILYYLIFSVALWKLKKQDRISST
jgi:hypothetical protein